MQATIASTDAERIPFWSALITDRRTAPALGLGDASLVKLRPRQIVTVTDQFVHDLAGDLVHLAPRLV